MNKTAFNGLVTLAFCLLVSCRPDSDTSGSSGGENSQEAVTAITNVSKARAAAFNRGDAAGIAVHFTEDALLMAPDKTTLQGRPAVEAYYQSIFNDFTPRLDSRYDEVEVSGDLAYGRGFAKVVLTPKGGGEPVTSTAKYLNILRRQPDGTWKTTHDIWNSNEPTK